MRSRLRGATTMHALCPPGGPCRRCRGRAVYLMVFEEIVRLPLPRSSATSTTCTRAAMPVCARHRLHPHLDPDSVPRPPLMRLAHGGRRHLINVAVSEELGGGSGGPTPSTMPLPVRVTLTPLPSKPSRPATSSAQTHQGSAQRQRGRREKISSMWYPSHLRFRSHFARGAKCAHKSQPRTLRGQDSRHGRATTVALCGIFRLQTRGKSQPHPALTPPTAFAPMTTRLSRCGEVCGEKVQQ